MTLNSYFLLTFGCRLMMFGRCQFSQMSARPRPCMHLRCTLDICLGAAGEYQYPGPHDGRQVDKSGFITSRQEVLEKAVISADKSIRLIEVVEGGRLACLRLIDW